MQIVGLAQRQTGLQNPRQPRLSPLQQLNLGIGANGDNQTGEQALLCQLRLGFVIIDVVLLNGLQLGHIARLARAQDHADGGIAQHLTNMAHQLQARVLLLHHHINQGDRKIWVLRQQGLRLLAGVSMAKGQTAAFNLDAFERQLGGGMHIRLIIDHQDMPHRWALRFLRGVRCRRGTDFFSKNKLITDGA